MRIIDNTPYLEEDGSVSLVNRIQGTLKNGFSWYGNLQAQSRALAYFSKQLDKKFTLIRNHTLGASQITIPFILIGPPGVYVFIVTNLEGTYRAKGNSWGKVTGDKYTEASINLVKRTMLFTKAVETYVRKQGIELPQPIEPIVLALNSGMHIETVRPAVRIVMSDAFDRFAVGLRQAPPVMTITDVHQIADLILSPLRKKSAPAKPIQAPELEANELDGVAAYDPYGAEQEKSAEANPFGDVGFSFDDEEAQSSSFEEVLPIAPPTKEAARLQQVAKRPRRKAPKKGLFGMTNKQLVIIAAMAGFIALILIAVIILALIAL